VIKIKKIRFFTGAIKYYHFGIYLGKNKQGEHEIFDLSGDDKGARIKP
jgi:hypothetical protein